VTRGSTLMGCLLKLREVLPSVEVQAFAIARVESATDLVDATEMMAPAVERIIYAEDADYVQRL
jgi:hypothetical protein